MDQDCHFQTFKQPPPSSHKAQNGGTHCVTQAQFSFGHILHWFECRRVQSMLPYKWFWLWWSLPTINNHSLFNSMIKMSERSSRVFAVIFLFVFVCLSLCKHKYRYKYKHKQTQIQIHIQTQMQMQIKVQLQIKIQIQTQKIQLQIQILIQVRNLCW